MGTDSGADTVDIEIGSAGTSNAGLSTEGLAEGITGNIVSVCVDYTSP